MSRGVVEFEQIQELIPEWGAVVLALLTQLGDNWFIIVLLGVLYLTSVRHRAEIAAVAGVWLAGAAAVMGLKVWFRFPRPAEGLLDPALLPVLIRPLYMETAFASGFGFPSGHAINATIVYFGLAHVLSVRTARFRYAVASAVVVIVGFTRVALGLHFLVDVVAGVAIGLALLAAASGLWMRRPTEGATVAFGLAIVAGGLFFVTSRGLWEAVMLFAAALGGFAGWQLVRAGHLATTAEPPELDRPILVRLTLAGTALLPLVAALFIPVLDLSPPALAAADLRIYTIGGIVGLATAGAVTVPIMWNARRLTGGSEEANLQDGRSQD